MEAQAAATRELAGENLGSTRSYLDRKEAPRCARERPGVVAMSAAGLARNQGTCRPLNGPGGVEMALGHVDLSSTKRCANPANAVHAVHTCTWMAHGCGPSIGRQIGKQSLSRAASGERIDDHLDQKPDFDFTHLSLANRCTHCRAVWATCGLGFRLG